MKKIIKYIVLPIFAAVILVSCYDQTIESLSTFKLQIPLNFRTDFYNKFAPDTTTDFANLNDYQTYRDNLKYIKRADLYQFTYWIDSLKMGNQTFALNDPAINNLEFEFIKFYLIFAKWNGYSWVQDTDPAAKHLLGEFKNVKVAEYYKKPKQVLQVSEDVAAVIFKAIKDKPQFFILSEYSKVAGQTEPKRSFPLIFARYDLVIRLDVEL
jgi:hypothetical protein